MYHPVQLKYHESSTEEIKGLVIHHHDSELVLVKTYPTLKKNDSFLSINKKLFDRISPQTWKTAITKPYKGLLVHNNSKDGYRYKWKFGTGVLKAGEISFVDAQEITDVWKSEREEWPRWTLNA